jgi:hypothetical protein
MEISSKCRESIFFVTHSFERDSSQLARIKQLSYYNALPNLGDSIERLRLPANAVSRNYSDLFRRLYEVNEVVDLVVALTGDTKIIDAGSFGRRFEEMQKNNYKLYACQAKGQYFWAKDKILSRLQTDGVADFMPQLFFVDGKFAFKTKIFSYIPVVNEYTSEQCLSEAFLEHAGLDGVGRLNNQSTNWMSYTDGVVWQVMTGGRPGRP